MSNKQKRKVKLPTDRNGTPIDVDDVLMWDDGTTLKVAVLNYYGSSFESIGCWTAEDEDEEFSDNLGASINLTKTVWWKQ